MRRDLLALAGALAMLVVGWLLNAAAWLGYVPARPWGSLFALAGVGLVLLGGFLLLFGIILLLRRAR